MNYITGEKMKINDIFTDGSIGREDVRLMNRAKVLYVDEHTLVWFPLNLFTSNHNSGSVIYRSNTWCLTTKPKKVHVDELTKEESVMFNNVYLHI